MPIAPVHDGVGGGFEGDFLHREGIAEDVLGELFAFGAVFRWHGTAGVNVEAGMFPGLHAGDQFWGDEFVGEQFLENSIAKEFGKNAVRDFRCELEGAVGIEQTVGDESMNMRMKIEVFVSAVIAANPGEATFQGAAVEEFSEDIGDNGAKGAVFVFIGVGINGGERVMVAMNTPKSADKEAAKKNRG